MTDNTEYRMMMRRGIMIKICELAEANRPANDPAMTLESEHRVQAIYELINHALDLPALDSLVD